MLTQHPLPEYTSASIKQNRKKPPMQRKSDLAKGLSTLAATAAVFETISIMARMVITFVEGVEGGELAEGWHLRLVLASAVFAATGLGASAFVASKASGASERHGKWFAFSGIITASMVGVISAPAIHMAISGDEFLQSVNYMIGLKTYTWVSVVAPLLAMIMSNSIAVRLQSEMEESEASMESLQEEIEQISSARYKVSRENEELEKKIAELQGNTTKAYRLMEFLRNSGETGASTAQCASEIGVTAATATKMCREAGAEKIQAPGQNSAHSHWRVSQ